MNTYSSHSPADMAEKMVTHLSLHVLRDTVAMAEAAAAILADQARKSIEERGVFTLALAGGKTPVHLFRALSTPHWQKAINWQKTVIFWTDERCVPPEHAMSNYRMAREELLSRIDATRYYRIKGEDDPDRAARHYEDQIEEHFGLKPGELPRFDCILLGAGSDGHTASLFPGDKALLRNSRLVTEVYQRKTPLNPTPVSRVTLTLPVLNNARLCLFMAEGRGKHDVLTSALNLMAAPVMPAQMVRPTRGKLCWVVDEIAYQG